MKSTLISSFGVLCCVILRVAGNDSNNPNPKPVPNSHENPVKASADFLQRLESLEEKNREQEKVNQEYKQQIKSLKTQLEEFKNEKASGEGLWLLTPPVRGPPGKKGEKGPKGDSDTETVRILNTTLQEIQSKIRQLERSQMFMVTQRPTTTTTARPRTTTTDRTDYFYEDYS